MEPAKIGKYTIHRELGRGAMGVVYEGEDPYIGRRVAIKTIRFDVLAGDRERDDAQRRFLREAQSAGNLSHPSIVTIYEVGEDEGLTYIAMEFVEGESLEARIRSGRRLTVAEVADLMDQLCDALDYAHRRGVIHRDIKPANILVDRDGRPRIVDFGIARIESSGLTQTATVMGTPYYMAPEQIAGAAIDHRADLFALGAVLYELLTFAKPFAGENMTTVIYRIMNVEPPPPREIDGSLPPGLDAVVRTALAKQPAARFQSGRALVEALRDPDRFARAQAGAATTVVQEPAVAEVIPATAEGPLPAPSAGFDTRRKAMIAVVGGMMAVLAIAAAVVVFSGRGGAPPAAGGGADAPPAADPLSAPGAVPAPDAAGAPAGQPAGQASSSAGPATTPASRPRTPTPRPANPARGSVSSPRGAPAGPSGAAPAGPPPPGPSVLPAPPPATGAPVVAGRVFELTGVDERPQVVREVPPVYPADALARRLEDVVIVKALVAEDGRVADVQVLRRSQKSPAFEAAAIEAVRQWVFTPARRKGQAVACWFNVGVPFQLPR